MAVEVRRHWKNYVFQSALATLTLLIALVLLRMQHTVIVASIGATAFIVFAMPDSLTAKSRNVIGGHAVGLVCGSLCAVLAASVPSVAILAYAVAVGLSILVMVVTDTEHPPASGTALGMAILPWSVGTWWAPVVAVITGALLLSLAHRVLRPYLRDLT